MTRHCCGCCRGPETLRFELDVGEDYDVKLALTSWAKGAFDVLHDLPPPPAAPAVVKELPSCAPALPLYCERCWHIGTSVLLPM